MTSSIVLKSRSKVVKRDVVKVTGVAEEGDSVSRDGACRRSQKLNAVIRGGATQEACLRDHAPHLRGLDVAKQHSERALQLQREEVHFLTFKTY